MRQPAAGFKSAESAVPHWLAAFINATALTQCAR
jgi:hypothetical protein